MTNFRLIGHKPYTPIEMPQDVLNTETLREDTQEITTADSSSPSTPITSSTIALRQKPFTKTLPAESFFHWGKIELPTSSPSFEKDFNDLKALFPEGTSIEPGHPVFQEYSVAIITKPNREKSFAARDSQNRYVEVFRFPEDSIEDYNPNPLQNPKLSKDKKRLEFIYALENNYDQYISIAIDDPNNMKILATDPQHDVKGILKDPVSDNIIAYSYLDTDKDLTVQWKVIDPNYCMQFSSLQKTIQKQGVENLSIEKIEINDNGNWNVFATYSNMPMVKFELKPTISGFEIVNQQSRNPNLHSNELATSKAISLQGANGQAVTALLTIPLGLSSAIGLPTIVMAHGGPHISFRNKYDSEVQYLVNQGYAVLQINHAGSLDHGISFRRAIYQNMTAAASDVNIAVKDAIHKGLIDTNNLHLMGHSAGANVVGFAIQQEPNLFKSAIISAPSLLNPQIEIECIRTIFDKVPGLRDRFIAFYDPNEVVDSSRIHTPLLILYGVNDWVLDNSERPFIQRQAEALAEGLPESTPFYIVRFEGAVHSVKHKPHVLQRLQLIKDFTKGVRLDNKDRSNIVIPEPQENDLELGGLFDLDLMK